jgi:hypothetical protein
MFCNSEKANAAIPLQFRKAAETILAAGEKVFRENDDALNIFVETLGIKNEFEHALAAAKAAESDLASEDFQNYLFHFQNNLDLLISKTWVEKDDNSRKEQLQDKLPALIDSIRDGNYEYALTNFGDILEELAYLFFGIQSEAEDFIEYTMRIDTEMGLFWWYCTQIRLLCEAVKSNKSAIRAVLLIGISYLTNF